MGMGHWDASSHSSYKQYLQPGVSVLLMLSMLKFFSVSHGLTNLTIKTESDWSRN